MKKWALANIILKMLDMLTTYYCVAKHGLRVESNPIVRWVFEQIGLDAGSIVVFAFFSFMIYILYQRNAIWFLRIMACIMSFVVISNFIAIILRAISF